ncbi:gamma-glutamyl kinase [Rhodobacteraceae bacterium NNCM2]|nr:gamma-glutamyl kinase [Coraliihabitans acroporae]
MRLEGMIASLKHRFVLFSMPKCASEALEQAMAPMADIVLRDPPPVKHCNYRRYARFLKPFLERFGDGSPETLCLFREPVDWLNSWWRYRQRPFLDGKPNSTQGLSFEQFVGLYLDEEGPAATIGRQSRFVVDKEHAVAIDHLWRYEDIAALVGWIEARTGWEVALGRVNVSPPGAGSAALSPAMRTRAMRELARDFEIYEGLAR